MLPIICDKFNASDVNIDLSNKFIGRSLKIDKNAKYTIKDDVIDGFVTVNNIKYCTLKSKISRILNTLNVNDHDFLDIAPNSLLEASKRQLYEILQSENLSSYFLKILPLRNQLTNLIVDADYDHCSSVTGRMKITKGQNYLTMKKKDRVRLINHQDKLVEIDIKSCEPALLHAVLYKETPEDIYSLFGKDIPRSKIKIAVISSIYGSTPEKVKNISGLERKDIARIHDHFQLKKIKNEILNRYKAEGVFYNLYGRPLYEINSPVNYWLQSSAADYSCLAFFDLQKKYNLNLKACIHDAIVVDIPKNKLDVIMKEDKITDPISNISLTVEYSVLN